MDGRGLRGGSFKFRSPRQGEDQPLWQYILTCIVISFLCCGIAIFRRALTTFLNPDADRVYPVDLDQSKGPDFSGDVPRRPAGMSFDTTGDGKLDTEIHFDQKAVASSPLVPGGGRAPMFIDTTGDRKFDHMLIDGSRDGRFDTLIAKEAKLDEDAPRRPRRLSDPGPKYTPSTEDDHATRAPNSARGSRRLYTGYSVPHR